jgi:serine/threonine-protein kinase
MSRASTDRNLLAGVIALQMDFINRDQLIAAMNAWVANKDQTLEQLLVSQGALDAEANQLLGGLIKRHLKQHGGDVERSLRAVPQLATIQAALQDLGDDQVNATLAHLPGPGGSGPATWQLNPAIDQPAGSRYRILRPHAKGGLGQVSVAEDEELHREVALKEIQERHADDLESRARFVQEAEVTGGLEHPGIVPVYGLGHYINGRPFYAMRFIRGDSLRTAIQNYHSEGREEDAGKRAVQFRGLINRFIAVCQAMEYAHSRGVVHRDIKPDNIMLGKYGETLVVDWGLAKQVGRADRPVTESAEPEQSLRLSSGSGTSPTMQGTAVGTPSYMSPEQAAGRLDEMGPPSDIYSLGATLYAILTGKPPVEGKTPSDIMLRVQLGDIAEPRTINPEIDRNLQAVCLKALAHSPADRYATAADLAHDLEQWLADEPVAALPETFTQRASRWSRRHRAWVRAGAGTLMVVSLVSIVAVVAINMAWAETKYFLQQSKELAIHNARLAQESNLAKQSAEKLAHKERIEREKATELAKKNLALADDNFKLAEEQRHEAEKANKLVEFLVGLFQANDPVGHGVTFFIPKANSEKLTAKDILERGAARVQDDPDLANFPLAKAAIMNTIGDVDRQLSLWDEARPLLEESLRIRTEQLPPDHADLATSYHNLGFYHHERGDFATAEKYYKQALAIRKKLPGEVGKHATAATLHNLAWMLGNEGESAEALKLFNEVLAIRRELHGELHREVVFTKFGIAITLIDEGKFLQAIPLVLAAQADFQKIEGNAELATAIGGFALGVAYRDTLGLAASEAQFRKSLELTRPALGPDSMYTAIVEFELARTLEDAGKLAEADALYAHCIRIADEQVQFQHPRLKLLVEAYSGFLSRQGKVAEGAQLWERFVPAQRRRFGPEHKYVARAEYAQASYHRRTRKYTEALKIFTRLENSPGLTSAQRAEVLQQVGICYLDGPEDNEQAVKYFRQAIVAFTAALPEGKERMEELLFPRMNLATGLTRLKQTEEAEQQLQAAIADAKQLGGTAGSDALDYAYEKQICLYFTTADYPRVLEVAKTHVALVRGKNKELFEVATNLGAGLREIPPAEPNSEIRQQLTTEILGILNDVQARGYRNSNVLQNTNFQALQDNPEFQAIAAALKPAALKPAPSKPATQP